MDQSKNPFASPHADLSETSVDSADLGNAESIRRKYLKHEASVKAISLLYYLSAFAALFGTIGLFIALFEGESIDVEIIATVFVLIVGVVCIFIGNGLRALNPKTKIPVGIFSAIGLLSIPIGTIINGYILYLIFSQKGKMVFSEPYHEVIRQTPHIKYKTSPVVIWLAVILGIVICMGIAAMTFFG